MAFLGVAAGYQERNEEQDKRSEDVEHQRGRHRGPLSLTVQGIVEVNFEESASGNTREHTEAQYISLSIRRIRYYEERLKDMKS